MNHPLYLFIAQLNSFRNAQINSIVPSQHIERYCDDTFYAWSRDMVFIATSNIGAYDSSILLAIAHMLNVYLSHHNYDDDAGSGQGTSRTITYHPYQEGTVLVDILDSQITYTVQNNQFNVNIQNGLLLTYSCSCSLGLIDRCWRVGEPQLLFPQSMLGDWYKPWQMPSAFRTAKQLSAQ